MAEDTAEKEGRDPDLVSKTTHELGNEWKRTEWNKFGE